MGIFQRALQDKSRNRQTLMDDKLAQYKFRQWHFWWLVVFSLFLIITFVYYLPTRFLQQMGAPHDVPMSMPIDESQPHGHDNFDNSIPTEQEDEDHMMNEHMKDEMMEDGMMGDHAKEGSEALYHEEGNIKEGLAVNLNVSPVPYNIGALLRMDFFVNQKSGNLPAGQTGVPVLASQLELTSTKLMHVIGVRSDMNEFFHIHPQSAGQEGVLTVNHIFNKPGLYKIWSEIKKDGVNHTFGHPEINVNGLGPKEEKKVSFSRNVMAGQYQVSLKTSDSIVKGKEVELSFDIHSLTGMEIEVEQYLGVDMHLAIIKDDWSQFIHTHPEGVDHSHSQTPQMINIALAHGGTEDEPTGVTDEHQTTTSTSEDEVISFHVTFPEAGLYKAFAQFRPKGTDLPTDEAITTEFWIQVEEKAPFPVSQWWGLLLASVILIAGLSRWVNEYLKVKPEDVKINK